MSTIERILTLMHDMELALCGNCVQKTQTPDCCNIQCEILFATLARIMVEGRSENQG